MSYIQHKSEESVEDYLETILILKSRLPQVRSIDIANEMHFSKPSVSVAMKNLRNRDYITVTEEGFIRLTEQGLSIAKTVYERHSLLSNWLMELGVDSVTAVADACKMEHDISAESFDALKKHILLHFPACKAEV
ncbi:MAG: metal-dependent transcriptional regulator [Hungatella sp.]|nr:metal-dependent transcriptional regulator [Hungatella sp.]